MKDKPDKFEKNIRLHTVLASICMVLAGLFGLVGAGIALVKIFNWIF